jgi:hypothetical protein
MGKVESMLPESIESAFNKTISEILEFSEMAFGTNDQWGLYRHILLKRLNSLKRTTEKELQQREGLEYEKEWTRNP